MAHGGKRRRHVLPALTPEQVREARGKRKAKTSYKELMRLYGVSRDVIYKAIHGRGCYEGVL